MVTAVAADGSQQPVFKTATPSSAQNQELRLLRLEDEDIGRVPLDGNPLDRQVAWQRLGRGRCHELLGGLPQDTGIAERLGAAEGGHFPSADHT